MEGPHEIVIPEQRFNSCQGCIHYSHSMIKSGNNPLYRTNCDHSSLVKDDLSHFSFMGNLHKNKSGYTETPDWCPILKNKENDNKN